MGPRLRPVIIALRRALPPALLGALLAGCGEGLVPEAQAHNAPPAAEVPAVIELSPAAGLEGDPDTTEREILDLSRAELGGDFVLTLPGSRGLAVEDRFAEIRKGGMSVGTPQRGALSRGVQLPFNPALYTRRDASRSYGSTHTIRTLQAAFNAMRNERGVHAEVIVGDLSRPRGGRFRPHVSHQSGRDIDIRLVVAAHLDPRTLPVAPEHVDWDATWALVHSFLETGHVRYIFLSHMRQKNLYEAGLRAGVHARVLDRWFQWPGSDPTSLIRHEDGHRAHIHVRLSCGPNDPRCRGQ